MLGAVMDSAKLRDTSQVSERTTLEEVTVPQRSITDFFTSPTKTLLGSRNKPTTLLGYFKGNNTAASTQQTSKNSKSKVEAKSQTKKRKRNSVEELNNSLSDFDTPSLSKGSGGSRKKVKSTDNGKKKQQKGSAVSKLETEGKPEGECQVGKENDELACLPTHVETSADVRTVSTDSKNRRKPTEVKRKHAKKKREDQSKPSSCTSAQQPQTCNQQTVIDDTCNSTADGQSHSHKLSKGSDAENLVKQSTKSSAAKQSTKSSAAKQSPKTSAAKQSTKTSAASKQEQTKLALGSDGNITVEVSYEEFLKSEGVVISEPEPEGCEETPLPQLTVPKCRKVLDYFKKKVCDQNSIPSVEKSASDTEQVLTTADVHFEPSPPQTSTPSVKRTNCHGEDSRTSHILISDEECDMEIFEISSEIIELTPGKPNCKTQGNKEESSAACDQSVEVDTGVDALHNLAGKETPSDGQKLCEQMSCSKTTQATLCFTKKGLGMTKVQTGCETLANVTPSESKIEAAGNDTATGVLNPKKSKRKKACSATDKTKSKTAVKKKKHSTVPVREETTTPPARRSPRIRKPFSAEAIPESQVKKCGKKNKKILRGRYRVAHLQPGCDNRSPIRIRLKRCSRNGGEEDKIGETTKPEKLQTSVKAKKLVEKAKRKKIMPEKTRSTKGTGDKGTKKAGKSTVNKTKQQAAGKNSKKLAPIFTKNKPAEPVLTKPKVSLDPEIVRQRQEFLKSSLPENLKRRAVATDVQSCQQYPPIPLHSHVQQAPATPQVEGVNPWDLPAVDLKLKDNLPNLMCDVICDGGKFDHMTESQAPWEPLRVPKEFSKHLDFSEKIVEVLLKEIQRNNPNFPVQGLYKCYKTKKEESETKDCPTGDVSMAAAETNTETSTRPDKVGVDSVSDIGGEKRSNKQKLRSSKRLSSSGSPPKSAAGETRRANRLRRGRRSKEPADQAAISDPDPAGNRPGESSPRSRTDQSDRTELLHSKVRDQLWSDKYQPSQSLEMIGNSGNIKKLKSWLQEWKEHTDKEARRMKKLLRKQQKKLAKVTEQESSSDWWTDDDSDFVDTKADSDWMDGEEEMLCNTMLITGPSGIGKTSAVYALAQELGYQVFEVNSTSSRSGKKILGKLQEATQSHQVSSQGADKAGPSTPSKTTLTVPPCPASPAQPAKLPTAFTNLFRKTKPRLADAEEVITIEDSGKKKNSKASGSKRKRLSSTEGKGQPSPKKQVKLTTTKVSTKPSVVSGESNSCSTMTSKGLNLSNTSLILFDEVDVVYEEDKGFWAAIQSFMNITKRPIILTTSDSRCPQKFEGRFDQLTFRKPPYVNIVTCLQLLCLVENVRTEFSDLLNLVEFYRGDLRRCIQSLQYWVESGGGVLQEAQPGLTSVSASGQLLLEDQLSQSPDINTGARTPMKGKSAVRGRRALLSDNSSDRVLVAYGGVVSQLRVVQDDSSVDSFQSTPRKKRPAQTVPEVDLMDENAMFPSYDDSSSTMENLPPVHRLCVESLIGVTAYSQTNLTDLFTGDRVQRAANISRLFQESNIDLTLGNLELLLPLSVTLVDSTSWPVRAAVTQSDSEGLATSIPDPSASDSSDSEWVFLKSKTSPLKEPTDKEPIWRTLCEKLTESLPKEQRNCLGLSVQYLSAFYEAGSLVDTFSVNGSCSLGTRRFTDLPDWDRMSLLPGLSDDLMAGDLCDRPAVSLAEEIAAELRVRSLAHCYGQLEKVTQTSRGFSDADTLEDQLSLPVLKGYHQLRLSEDWPIRSLTMSSRKKAMENVISSLPLHTWGQPRSVSLDYTPVLRSICAAEQVRHVSKIKRRFLHYLDGISFPLKEFTMNVLGTSLR